MTHTADPMPNIHYIGVIEEKNSKGVFTKYPIDLPRKLLDKLLAIGKDDDDGSLLALQAELTNYYPEDERKTYYSDYLAPRNYTSSYVDKTRFPKIWTQDEYYSNSEKFATRRMNPM